MKKLFRGLLGLTAASVLASCGGSAAPAASPSAAPSSPVASAKPTSASPAVASSAAPASAKPAAASAPASAAAASQGAGKKLRVGLSVAESFDVLPVYVAQSIGSWSKRGLDVEVSGFNGAAGLMQAMAANSVDIGFGSSDGASNAIIKGSPMKIVAEDLPSIGLFVLITGSDSGVSAVDDLKGKTIGVTSHGSITEVLGLELARSKGWTAGKDLQIATIGGLSEQAAALKRHQTAGFNWTAEAGYQLEERGEGKILLSYGSVLKDFESAMIEVTDQASKKDPDAIKAFLQGQSEAVKYLQANKDQAVQIGASKIGVSPTVAAKTYDLVAKEFSSDGVISRAKLQAVLDVEVAHGLVDKSAANVDALVDPQYAGLK